MNKKGFTLIELLAVIAILAILAGIATPIVLTVQKNIKNKMLTAKIKEIKAAAVLYAEKENLASDTKITISKLCFSGFLDNDKEYQTCNNNSEENCKCQQNPATSNPMGGCNIILTKQNNRWKAAFDGKKGSIISSDCPTSSD